MSQTTEIHGGGRSAMVGPRVLLALALAVTASLLSASPAFAIFDHNELQAKFASGCPEPSNAQVQDLAVDETRERVYVYCDFNSAPNAGIFKLTYNGAASNWEATKPYIAGNELIGNPGAANGSFISGFAGGHITVDNSGGPNSGLIYILAASSGVSGGTDNIQIFAPSGEFLGSIVVPQFSANARDIDVGPDGSLYFMTENRVSKYSTGYNEIGRMFTGGGGSFGEGSRMVADSNGAVWTESPTKFEPDQMFTNFPPSLNVEQEQFTGKPSPFVPQPLIPGAFGFHLAIDPNRNDLYVNRGNKIEVFSQGTAAEHSFASAPAFGNGGNVAQPGIAVTKNHLVFTSAPNAEVSRFGPGQILPDVHTYQVDVDHIGHESAEITGEVELDGGTPVTSCQLQIGTTTAYADPPVACNPSSFNSDSAIEAEPIGLDPGTPYHYRFKATNEKGSSVGIDRTFVPAYVLKVKTLAASPVSEHEATLRGSLDPDGKETEYFFKYGVDTNYGSETVTLSAGSGSGVTNLSTAIQGLPSGRTFHYRLVATNADGTTMGEDQVFRTSSPPDIAGLRATDLTESAATLHATINPVGFPTTYRFEYGPTSDYGQSIPVPDEDIGSGTEPVPVEQRITGLTPGVTYHFRVVATNDPWGTAVSTDTTFDFAPPACPNDHVRQETASSYLPDCRAYELVSPGRSGAVQLFPSQEAWDLYNGRQDPLVEEGMWALNNGLASGPPRFMFYGLLGTIEGLAAPNLLTTDNYLATRTNSGWVTTLPGLDDHFGMPAGKECSDSMNRCLEYNKTFGSAEGEIHESLAYLFTAEGKFIERLPSIANIIPGANKYKGFKRTSGDFSNFAFSSRDTQGIFGEPYPGVIFTPEGQTEGAGSAYDNDIEHRSVELISQLPGGAMIPQNQESVRPIQFPAISTDGTHILMLTEATKPGPPYHLYMSVNDALHYDVSKGTAEEFVGMTKDGSKVTFTSKEKLTPADTDNSIDLYRWEEATDTLTLLSVGNGQGNNDGCSATWIEGCGVEVPNTERRYAMMLEVPFGNEIPYFEGQGLDDVTAENTGDVYFYSPESLDADKFGIANQRNLYVVRPDNSVHLVATLDVGTQVKRMNISRDGSFAAILTPSKLTSYENRGFDEVYLYDAEEDTFVCASCNPEGPPTKNVTVAMGGRFMADTGRTFFATKDQLVPRDKNGAINDVYEYVGGRPQLISGALASRDFTGEAKTLGLFAKPETTGLEAVSRDGQDVYFSTFATLVDEDHNGQYVKFYDARTNGGFAQPPVAAPCAAADECHGPDSSPPAPPLVTSGTDLGASGNMPAKRKSKTKKAKKKKKAHRRKARARRHGRTGGRSNG